MKILVYLLAKYIIYYIKTKRLGSNMMVSRFKMANSYTLIWRDFQGWRQKKKQFRRQVCRNSMCRYSVHGTCTRQSNVDDISLISWHVVIDYGWAGKTAERYWIHFRNYAWECGPVHVRAAGGEIGSDGGGQCPSLVTRARGRCRRCWFRDTEIDNRCLMPKSLFLCQL